MGTKTVKVHTFNVPKAFVLCLTVCIILGFIRMLHFFNGNVFNAVITFSYNAIIVSFVGCKETKTGEKYLLLYIDNEEKHEWENTL